MDKKGALKYYPVSLDIRDKSCLVVGGGSVGARKALTLARCGAIVKVVSPIFSDEFNKKIVDINGNKTGDMVQIRCIQKYYDSDDLDSIFIVVGATDNMVLNKKIAADAKAKQILCNIADFPEGSSFVLPSIVQRGDLVITVSTSGNSPAFAKKLRKELELQFGDEYAAFLTIMGKIRKWLLAQNHLPESHAKLFRELVNSELLQNISSKDYSKVESTLKDILCNSRELVDNSTPPPYQDFIFGD
ncbi:MAG: bifunctional precorrin-2 dehydrogenase/sirohydrochlorin ferrochelatase [Desulfamplus sp.]|nr:bifunctional precorrin-2 dehydrogenase/sirohydrochlorin ferrochelatase [Desulfamplus sp.]